MSFLGNLTIAIPIWRRPNLLDATLNSIFKQNKICNVLLIDDSVSNINSSVIKKYKILSKKKNINFSVIYNKKNIGIDENIKKCINSVKTKYIWLLGEDDLLINGSLNMLDKISLKNNYPYYFINYIYSNGNFTNTARHPVIKNKGIYEDTFCNFSLNNLPYIGFIGSCIINKEKLVIENLDKYIKSYYSHVGLIIDSSINHKILIISDVLVLNRAEDINTFTWSKSVFDVYHSFFHVLENSSLKNCGDNKYKLTKKNAYNFFKIHKLSWLAAKRGDGIYNFSIYRKYYSALPFYKKYLALLIAFFPVSILFVLRKIQLFLKFYRKNIY